MLIAAALASCTIGDDPVATVRTTSATTSESVPPPANSNVPDLTGESCEQIRLAMAGGREAIASALSDPLGAPAEFEQVADNLRAAAADAVPDLTSAVEEIAAGFDRLADSLRSGDLQSLNVDFFVPGLDRIAAVCN